MRGHMTRSECKISFCNRERGSVRKQAFTRNDHFFPRQWWVKVQKVLNTTELRNFSGSGSLISRGGSSGVLLSSSGKNLERTKDLPHHRGKKKDIKVMLTSASTQTPTKRMFECVLHSNDLQYDTDHRTVGSLLCLLKWYDKARRRPQNTEKSTGTWASPHGAYTS